jgi:adenine modification enzyme
METKTNNIQRLKVTSSKMGNLVIKIIPKETAKELIIKNHYSRKWNEGGFGIYNFGIFKEGAENIKECLGVAVYGYTMHPKAKQFSHPNPKAIMLELNRMWIDDELGKNSESILISHSLRMLHKINPNVVAVQSFADGRLGCGTIYKASNFKYYGSHKTLFHKNKRTGEIQHDMNLTRMDSKSIYIRNNVSYLLGDFDSFKVDTYRYIFPLCRKFKSLHKQRLYPIYKKGIEPVKVTRDKNIIKERLIGFIKEL